MRFREEDCVEDAKCVDAQTTLDFSMSTGPKLRSVARKVDKNGDKTGMEGKASRVDVRNGPHDTARNIISGRERNF